MRLEGQQIGRYRFERLIGRGGMGEVYLAVDPRISQQVAVKVMQAEPSVYPTMNVANEAERFRREASAVAMLKHPRIVPLYDYNEATIEGNTITYLVVPFYEEGSLMDWLRKRGSGLLPIEDVVHFVQQAAEALQYAHNHQVIHRDVKPSNFLIDTGENPNRPNLLLTDFGISKFGVSSSGGTQSLGTLTYMAPEQLDGRPTYAGDQYSLAIMAYELLVGRPPFQGPPPEVIRQHMEEQPTPPSMLNPRLPRAIDTVILRALDKKPENRFPSIAEFARALGQAVQTSNDMPKTVRDSGIREAPESPLHAYTPGPQRGSGIREPLKGRDIYETVSISPVEAQMGTRRLLSLPQGQQVKVQVPAHAYNGQMLTFPGLGEPSPAGGPAGNLIVTVAIAPQYIPSIPRLPQVQPPVPGDGSKKPNKAIIGISAVLVALLVIVGLFAVLRSRSGSGPDLNATATVQANASATAAIIAANPNPYPPNTGTLALLDPLNDNSKGYNWDSSTGSCELRTGGLHVIVSQQHTFIPCYAKATNFSNFTFEIQMTILKGDCGGIIFRADSATSKLYFFRVCQDGFYKLIRYLDRTGTSAIVLAANTSMNQAIKTGLNAVNKIAVVAQGSSLDLYVNGTKITSTINDSAYDHGQIGVVADARANLTEVVFSNARIWA